MTSDDPDPALRPNLGFFAVASLLAIPLAQANDALIAWEHKMGTFRRPNGDFWAHGLFHHEELVALTISSSTICQTVAGLPRAEVVELARLCARRPGLNRVVLRLWREFIFPLATDYKQRTWAISYQDEALHTGNTYRFDGWVRLKEHARSGTDARSGRVGRTKTIWGWHPDPAQRAARAISSANGATK